MKHCWTLSLFILLFGCQQEHVEHHHVHDPVSVEAGRLTRMAASLRGFPVFALEEIVTDPPITTKQPRLLFLISQQSCDTCVYKGLSFLNKIALGLPSDQVFVVDSGGNAAIYSENSDYKGRFYPDPKSEIRTGLKYTHTPALFLLDEESMVVDVYYPRLDNDDFEQQSFTKNAIAHLSL